MGMKLNNDTPISNEVGNRKTSEIVSKCMIDGHYIGYVQCFIDWCRHWATDELKWIGGDDE